MSKKLSFRFSSMNAGKSTALIQVAFNYVENDKKVLLYTAAVDTRYGVGKITSQLGPSRDAIIFDDTFDFIADFFARGGATDCILVDEAQFLLPQQVVQLHQIAQCHDVPVICYGLRSDFQGNAFPGASCLLTLAEEIIEMKTICSCGKKATMNLRRNPDGGVAREGSQISIGGNAQYSPVCGKCFYAAQTADTVLSKAA